MVASGEPAGLGPSLAPWAGCDLLAGEVDEFLGSLDDGAAFGCACDGDAASAAKLEQSLVPQQSQGA